MPELRSRPKFVLVVLAALLACSLAGCKVTGYSIRPPYNTQIKTVYVPTFKSTTFRRDVNLQLTELVCKEIERRTPYKVVGNPDGADSTLEGSINYTEKNIVIEGAQANLPRQLTSTIIITVNWVDNTVSTDDRKNANPAVVADTFNFYPEIGETASAAYYRTAEKIAAQIVNMMEEPW
jgi:hypothetical protein